MEVLGDIFTASCLNENEFAYQRERGLSPSLFDAKKGASIDENEGGTDCEGTKQQNGSYDCPCEHGSDGAIS
jgi:hypothetical protein